MGAFYFTMPDDNVRLLPLVESPVLRRADIERRKRIPRCTGRGGKEGRQCMVGPTLKGKKHSTEEEVTEGIVVKHYN
jgi:hypothetical protein